jgi:thiol-disulfide isomerase/thioredoxin
MKRFLLIAMLLLVSMAEQSIAHPGYHIHLKIPGIKDSTVYLTHYYGKPLPSIYKRDSARLDKNGNAEFKSNDSTFVGGIYMMLLADRKTYFEFLINNGDDISITADLSKLPQGLKFKNSPENERFQEYVDFLKSYSDEQLALKKEYSEAKTAADTSTVRKKAVVSSKKLTAYRQTYVKQYPGTLLASIFSALQMPEVPEGTHYLADGVTKDSTFAYRYYKSHFWDGFNFQDDRLIHTPIYDAKIDEYMNKLVLPWPDSVEKEGDMLLQKSRGTKDLFKYTLWWLTRNVENSKVMGMDEVFVYLVENYYMKGDAFWLGNDELQKYLDRAQKIAPNVIGNLAPEVKLPNVMTNKEESLQAQKASYTLLIFYSPSCGHCQHEIPALDSLYQSTLKAKGVKIFTVATEGDEKAISGFITKNKLEEWTNTWDHEHVGDWRGKYDVYSTPTIYLLDEKKIIRGKRLDHSNIAGLVEMLEKKAKKDKTTKSKS